MTADTPYLWLSAIASDDPGRVFLIDDEQQITYGDALQRVKTRADELGVAIQRWEIVPVEVSLNVASVIEIISVQMAGGVPLPYVGGKPPLPVGYASDVAVCVSTSGSSGVEKIVPLTFANIAAAVDASRERLSNTSADRWLVSLPLNHVGGLSIIWRTLEAGGTAIVAPFDGRGLALDRHDPTVASMVPTMLGRLLESNPDALASLRWVLVGGAALNVSLHERCIAVGVSIQPTYGLTEAGSQVATGHAGLPLGNMTVTIIGDDGGPVPPGASGVIAIDGPAVFSGYLGDAPRQGAFTTNDIGRLDTEGKLVVEGRIDHVIISGGENVSLGHVAATIMGYDGVRDVCMVGIDDAEWGTIGCAMIVSVLGLESFDTMVRSDLQPHERPKRWLFTDVIPALANGKHDLAAVRAAFEEEPWT